MKPKDYQNYRNYFYIYEAIIDSLESDTYTQFPSTIDYWLSKRDIITNIKKDVLIEAYMLMGVGDLQSRIVTGDFFGVFVSLNKYSINEKWFEEIRSNFDLLYIDLKKTYTNQKKQLL